MAMTERTRHTLYTEAIRSLGEEAANVLMETLPPVGWGDVATRQYVDHKFDLVDQRFDYLTRELKEFVRAEIGSAISTQTRSIIYANVATICSLVGAAFAFKQLLR